MNQATSISIFRSQRQLQIFQVLCLSTIMNTVLVLYRIYYTGFDLSQISSIGDVAHTRSETFMFLIWNLFLAWIPYLLSLLVHKISSVYKAVLVLVTWLLFLPNAPYLVTDLLHVRYHPPVPFWYDTIMLFSFAWTGFLLGFISLLEVRKFLENKLNKMKVSLLVWGIIGLCAFGVYLGRYQRWNTWDVITRPELLFRDSISVLVHPLHHIGSLGLAVVMFGLLGTGYLTFKVLVKEN